MVAAAITWKKVKHTDRVRNIVDPAKLKMPVKKIKVSIDRLAKTLER